jgi:hypothetical protein
MQMESMDWVCDYCGGEGKVNYPTKRMEEATLIICSHCSQPSAYVWCEVCGMGGQIAVTEFSHSPKTWQCMECDSEYELSEDFYQTNIVFTPVHFVDVKGLKRQEFLEFEKNIPSWAKNAFEFWEEKRVYLAYGMIGTSILFIILAVSVNFFGTKALFFPIILFGGLLPIFLFLFWLIAELSIRLISKVLFLIYKFRKFRE